VEEIIGMGWQRRWKGRKKQKKRERSLVAGENLEESTEGSRQIFLN
jgi:hypothetical protein